MDVLAVYLTNYIIKNGVIDQKSFDVYKYGFQVMLEAVLSTITCVIISICMNMILECILFFAIFIPIRAYAGGLHMDEFKWCYVCSCLVVIVVLASVKNFSVDGMASLIISLILLIAIRCLYPVEHANRELNQKEVRVFKRKIKKIIFIDFLFVIGAFITGEEKIAFLFNQTFCVVTLTMVLGKINNIRTSLFKGKK